MKKIKLFLSIAIFACMTVGGYSAYDNMTMTDAEILMLANVEALTSDETTTTGKATEHHTKKIHKTGQTGCKWSSGVCMATPTHYEQTYVICCGKSDDPKADCKGVKDC